MTPVISLRKINHTTTILIIIFLIVIPFGESKQYVAGESYTFIGPTPPVGETYSYIWIASDGSPTTSHDTTFQWTAPLVTQPTKVLISLLIDNGCTSQNETELLVVPEFSVTVPDEVICPGSVATLNATISGCTAISYQWYIGDSPSGEMIPDTNSPTYQTTKEGIYTCEVRCDDERKSYGSASVSFKQCESPAGSVSGRKFEDKNGNSEWDSNEPGLGEWIINLKSQDGVVVKSAITSSSPAALGSYSINGISPGTYTLEEVPSSSADWTQTYPAGKIYSVVVLETGVVTVTKSDQTDVPSTNADFGNKFTQSGELEITKATSAETIISNAETTFTITVQNTGKIEIHDLKIVDELSPMLEFIPYAYYGDILIQHTLEGGKLIFDLAPLGSLLPGNSWTITYNVKLSPEACTSDSGSTVSPPVASAGETKLNVMAAGSENTRILQIIDSLSRNKTKLEVKLESIKKQQGTFDKDNASVESSTTSIAGTNYTRNNYTNISTGETLIEQLDSAGFLVLSEYTRSVKYDLLTTTYKANGEVLSDFYTFLPTNETLLIEYDKPGKGYRTYTVRYYATGDTLIITVDSQGSVVNREYRKTPGITVPEYLTNCATAYGNAGEQNEPVESNRDCVDVRWRCTSPLGSISGTKFEDINGNNEWDANEPGLGDWMINLLRQDGEIVKVAITSASPGTLGSYSIDSISPGTYTLVEVLSISPGWTQTYPVGNYYTVVVLETGQVTVTKSDQTSAPSTQVNFGNMFTHHGELEITKATPTEIINPNSEAIFIIDVLNTGDTEIYDIQIVDELSPMLEFIPYAYCGDILIQHSFDSGNLLFDLSPLGSLEPGDSWTIVYNVKLSTDACNAVSTSTTLPTIASADETKLKVMDAGSSPADLLQIIDALSRNKTKLEAKLESIKKKRDKFNKADVALESGIRSIAGTNYTLINCTNISTGETLNEQLNSTGFPILSEYTRPAKFDQLTTTYDTKGEVISDFYTFLPTKETLKIEYNKPDKGYRTYTVRYYATGDTLIMTIDSYGMVVFREYRRTPGLAEPEYLTNCAIAYGKVGSRDGSVVSNRACVNLGWSCQTPQPLLRFRVFKEADRELATPGDIIRYKYTVENNGTIALTSLTLNDDKLGIIVLNDPDTLEPGESRTYYTNHTVKAGDGPKLVNTVVATALDPDGNEIESKTTENVEIITATICLTKTASPKVVRPGDYVTYNITWYGSTSGDLIVDDYPEGVSFISASPTPIDDGNNNKWKIDGLVPGTIIILVQVAKDIGNTSFDMDQGVTGTGFVNVHNDIRTNPVILKNKATLYENEIKKCTASADVNVGPPQTYVALKEHGSGDYASEDVIRYHNSNRFIQRTKGLTATHKPTTFSLPNNRNVDFMSKWSEKAESKNYATGGSTNEE